MKKTIFIIVLVLLLLPVVGLGDNGVTGGGPPQIITNIDQIVDLLDSALAYMWVALTIFITIMFLYAGFMFITAAGDDEKIKTAKKIVLWSIIGVVVMLLASGIRFIIQSFLEGA